MPRQFLRVDTVRYSRLGRNRRKLRKWRRPRGKSNKTRLKRFSYPTFPTMGHRTARSEAGKVKGLMPKLVHNLAELQSIGKNEGAIIARIGARKKLELIKKADELKINILNLNNKKTSK